MRWKIVGYVIGGAILAAGVAMYARVVVSERTHNLTPLSVPVSLAQGTVTTAEVPVDTTRRYDIVIEAETARLKSDPVKPDLEWRLSDNGSPVAGGSSLDQPSRDWAGTYEQRLGRFIGQSGHHYVLVVNANSGTSRLAAAKPVLKVQIPQDDWEGYGAGEAIYKAEAGIVVFVGLLILGASFGISRKADRKTTLEPADAKN
jgi:hypothetical protein